VIKYSAPRSPRRTLVSLTPLVDVVFILLIFFMLASSFNDWRGLRMSLPPPGTISEEGQNPVILTLTNGRGVLFEGNEFVGSDLALPLGVVLRANPDRPVIIRVAPGVVLQDSIDLLDMLDGLGGADATLVEQVQGESSN
jgi:biopolymer transport protein ExbD